MTYPTPYPYLIDDGVIRFDVERIVDERLIAS